MLKKLLEFFSAFRRIVFEWGDISRKANLETDFTVNADINRFAFRTMAIEEDV